MSTFEELASVRAGDVKAPVAIPDGHYEAIIAGPMTPHKAKSGNIAMRFPCQLVSAGDDVDAEALTAATENKPLSDRKFNLDYWMSPDAQFRFTNFARSTGTFDDNLTLVQIAERIVEDRPRFTVEVKTETDSNDASKKYTRFDNAVGFESFDAE